MENRVERLERLLNEHAPHVRLDDEMDMGDGDSPSSAGGASGNPLKRPRSPPASVRTYPPRAPSPPVHRGPAPFYGPDRSSPNTRMAGGPGSGSLSAGPSPSSLFERPGISPAGLGGTPTAGGRVFDTVGAADAYERQPRNASGYEWDERRRGATCENDGTASLSIEPDGEGYLGESGAGRRGRRYRRLGPQLPTHAAAEAARSCRSALAIAGCRRLHGHNAGPS